jgi:hypothetical protein
MRRSRSTAPCSWHPGEGNVDFDLAIAANNFPIADIASFLDFAKVPATGDLTGTLRIAGARNRSKAAAA